MELFTNCKNCQEDYPIKSNSDSRYELENDLGGYFFQQCPKCLSQRKYHVNEVMARVSQKALFVTVGIVLVASTCFTVFLWQMGFGTVLPATLPLLIVSVYYLYQSKAVSTFNRHLIKRDK